MTQVTMSEEMERKMKAAADAYTRNRYHLYPQQAASARDFVEGAQWLLEALASMGRITFDEEKIRSSARDKAGDLVDRYSWIADARVDGARKQFLQDVAVLAAKDEALKGAEALRERIAELETANSQMRDKYIEALSKGGKRG